MSVNMPMKKCSSCGKIKYLSEYYPARGRKERVRWECKECTKKMGRKDYYKDVEKIRKKSRVHARKSYYKHQKRNQEKSKLRRRPVSWKYQGIECTMEMYDERFIEQRGRCAICGKPQSEIQYALGVDHNHFTGQIRSLLCPRCNAVLGFLEQSEERMKKYKDYLDLWEKKE